MIDESYAAAMEEAEQMAEVTPRVPGDPAPKYVYADCKNSTLTPIVFAVHDEFLLVQVLPQNSSEAFANPTQLLFSR